MKGFIILAALCVASACGPKPPNYSYAIKGTNVKEYCDHGDLIYETAVRGGMAVVPNSPRCHFSAHFPELEQSQTPDFNAVVE